MKAAEVVQEGTGRESPTLRVSGYVTDISRNDVKVLDTNRNLLVTIEVPRRAQVTRNGQQIEFDDLEEGMQVRATYQLERDNFVARQLEVMPWTGQPQGGGTQSPGSNTTPQQGGPQTPPPGPQR